MIDYSDKIYLSFREGTVAGCDSAVNKILDADLFNKLAGKSSCVIDLKKYLVVEFSYDELDMLRFL